jgi:hypothetical protein
MKLNTIKKISFLGSVISSFWLILSIVCIWFTFEKFQSDDMGSGYTPLYYVLANIGIFFGSFIFYFLWRMWIDKLLRINGLDGLWHR